MAGRHGPLTRRCNHRLPAAASPGRPPVYDSIRDAPPTRPPARTSSRPRGASRARLPPGRDPPAAARAAQLRDHLGAHVRVGPKASMRRCSSWSSGTPSGKSTLFNTLAGRAASPPASSGPPPGCGRPGIGRTGPLLEGTLAGVRAGRLRLVVDASLARGVALVDAPDIESIEQANRELADRLVEAADLCLFVTTATRYADRVPWAVLGRVRERGLPLIVVVNRMPHGPGEREEILADTERLFAAAGLADSTASGHQAPLQLLGVGEGDVEPGVEGLRGAASAVRRRVRELRRDRTAGRSSPRAPSRCRSPGWAPCSRRIATTEGTRPSTSRPAADREPAYEREPRETRTVLGRGTFLLARRAAAWQPLRRRGPVTRMFSRIGRVRAPSPPCSAARAPSRRSTPHTDDCSPSRACTRPEAARRIATVWRRFPRRRPIADSPTLGPLAGLRRRLRPAGRVDRRHRGGGPSTGSPRQRLARARRSASTRSGRRRPRHVPDTAA